MVDIGRPPRAIALIAGTPFADLFRGAAGDWSIRIAPRSPVEWLVSGTRFEFCGVIRASLRPDGLARFGPAGARRWHCDRKIALRVRVGRPLEPGTLTEHCATPPRLLRARPSAFPAKLLEPDQYRRRTATNPC